MKCSISATLSEKGLRKLIFFFFRYWHKGRSIGSNASVISPRNTRVPIYITDYCCPHALLRPSRCTRTMSISLPVQLGRPMGYLMDAHVLEHAYYQSYISSPSGVSSHLLMLFLRSLLDTRMLQHAVSVVLKLRHVRHVRSVVHSLGIHCSTF